MKYHQIAGMCRPRGLPAQGAPRGCPHDGLGCIGGERCSINSPDLAVSTRAYNASGFGPDFVCVKHDRAATPTAARKEDGRG